MQPLSRLLCCRMAPFLWTSLPHDVSAGQREAGPGGLLLLCVCPSLAAGGRWDAYKHDVSRINVEANFGAGSGGNEQQEGGAG